MNLKKSFMLLSLGLILLFGISLYRSYFSGFKIVNETNETIDLNIVSGINENIENISVQKLSTKTVKLSKDENIVNVVYYYNNKQAAESIEVFNKQINSKYSKMIINSIDNNNKLVYELK